MNVARLRTLMGREAEVDLDPSGLPRVAPVSTDGAALMVRTAAVDGLRVRVVGAGTWMPQDQPADLVLCTRLLNRVLHVAPQDLAATVESGIRWDDLRNQLAEYGTWLALDPPGSGRSLGSVLATGTAGPLAAGFGPVRDHILGITLVTGDGRVVRVGGRLVKNVAGFDLTKLAIGSHGAFGIIASVHLRLRAVPRADLTLTAEGQRDRLLQAARAVMDGGIPPAALELCSPNAAAGGAWVLAIRMIGTPAEVEAERRAVQAAADISLSAAPPAPSGAWWRHLADAAAAGTVTIRLGALPTALDTALDLVAHYLDEPVDDPITVCVPRGIVRWSGSAAAERVALLRSAAAQQEIPVTIERAPWEMRRALGHFGAYREGAARLVDGLVRSFDPRGVLGAPLGAAT
jgi:glycolate oxidase FAD binding subunit